MKQNLKSKIILLILIFFLLLLIIFAIINTSICDKDFHIERINELAIQIKEIGLLKYPYYINFSSFYGMGYALETFYSDFFAIIPALFINANININIIYAITIIVSFVLILASSFKTYDYFYNNIKDAMYFGIIYSFGSFILFEIIERNAFGTNFAYIFIPWIIFSFFDIIEKNEKKYNYIILGISMAGLILSHVQTTIIIVLLLFCYFIIKIKVIIKEPKRMLQILKACLICILLDSFFIFPMIEQITFQKLYLKSSLMTYMENSYMHILNIAMPNFVWNKWINLSCSNIITKITQESWILPSCFIPTIFMIIIITKYIKHEKTNYKYTYIVIIISLILSFTKLLSYCKAIDFMQFPWRLMTITTILVPFLFIKIEKIPQSIKKMLCYITICNGIIYVILICVNYYNPNINFKRTIGQGEYLPSEISNQTISENIKKIKSINYGNEYQIDISNLENKEEIELPIVYYKGYKVYEVDNKNNNEIEYKKSSNGLILIKETDKNELLVRYEGTTIQKITKIISFFSMLILIFYSIYKVIKKHCKLFKIMF